MDHRARVAAAAAPESGETLRSMRGDDTQVARSTRANRRVRRRHHGLFEVFVEGASEIVGSVAMEVAPEVVGILDIDSVVREIDLQAALDRIDVNLLLERINLDVLLARLDLQALVDRLDVDQIVAKLDVNALLEHVDVDALVERTEIGALIARSGAGVAGKVLDTARSQGVGLDSYVHRCMSRLLRRDVSAPPGGPPLLVGAKVPAA
jgi:hypothetical protein